MCNISEDLYSTEASFINDHLWIMNTSWTIIIIIIIIVVVIDLFSVFSMGCFNNSHICNYIFCVNYVIFMLLENEPSIRKTGNLSLKKIVLFPKKNYKFCFF